MYLRQVGWWGMDSIDLSQDKDRWQAVVNELSVSIKYGEFLE
jgi:hypothetical protein